LSVPKISCIDIGRESVAVEVEEGSREEVLLRREEKKLVSLKDDSEDGSVLNKS
jgi:hypothetical protein